MLGITGCKRRSLPTARLFLTQNTLSSRVIFSNILTTTSLPVEQATTTRLYIWAPVVVNVELQEEDWLQQTTFCNIIQGNQVG